LPVDLPKLLTVGHGTLPAAALAELLLAAGVTAIVDVRTVPKSARHPQFRIEEMERWLPQAGIAYRWEPALGGFRKSRPDSHNVALRHPSFRGYADYMETPQFSTALASLLAQTNEQRTAALCSESLWWRCHRRLIADAATVLHATDVLHLMHDGKLRPHILTQGVREAAGRLRYDATYV
jgi:uncharacterized protein (DUF488 family)